jgi:hypothetical protein
VAELRLDNTIIDDRYLVDRCLGRGSYAECFLAFDGQNGDEPVIIKALNTSLQGTPDVELERTLVENFQNEAIALDRVRHPNIIRRLGHGTAADLDREPFHYLVLEYMAGGDLLKLCTRRPMSLDQTLFLFQQVAEALAYAHARQVIHRDVKPNNLLLSADERVVKIADFGVAKMTRDDSVGITRVGTNVYAPPEHHPDAEDEACDERLTPSADIYSLAKTIYTAMTGRAPRQFSRQAIAELPIELRGEPWASKLAVTLQKATAARVADRYQTVQEFWSDLAKLRLGETEEVRLAEEDEATIVRRRLKADSSALPATSSPDFQRAVVASQGAERARIVVELPHKVPVTTVMAENRDRQAGAVSVAQASSARGSLETRTLGSDSVDQGALAKAPGLLKRISQVRLTFRAAWLRWVFAAFLVAAIAGIVTSTFYHYAERGSGPGWFAREGVIGGAENVNLRSEPSGPVMAVLPAGTRVRVLEERGNWTRVRILQWMGAAQAGAPDNGWVGNQYVKNE